MSDLPAWLTEILRQSPVLVATGAAVWYVERRVRAKEARMAKRAEDLQRLAREREEKIRAEVREDRDAEIKRFQQAQQALLDANAKLVAAKDAQLARLTEAVEAFAGQLAALAKKLPG